MVKTAILRGDGYHVDFSSAVEMTAPQRERFIAGLKKMFKVVEVESVKEIRTERLGEKLFMQHWSPEEYGFLLQNESVDTLVDWMGRSWMSIDIKRGKFLQGWQDHLTKKNIDPTKLTPKQLISLITEYLKEQEMKSKSFKKRELKNTRERIRQIEELESRFPLLLKLKKIDDKTITALKEEKMRKTAQMNQLELELRD